MSSLLMHYALGVIQRISIKHKAQNVILRLDVIDWICNSLRDSNKLEKYTLQYLTALLMNLALRTEGKRRCEVWINELLNILKSLLNEENFQIRTYVNGTLYSLFGIKNFRIRARVLFEFII